MSYDLYWSNFSVLIVRQRFTTQLSGKKLQMKKNYVCKSLPDNCKSLPDDCKSLPDNCKILSDDCKSLPDNCKRLPDDCKSLPDNSIVRQRRIGRYELLQLRVL